MIWRYRARKPEETEVDAGATRYLHSLMLMIYLSVVSERQKAVVPKKASRENSGMPTDMTTRTKLESCSTERFPCTILHGCEIET